MRGFGRSVVALLAGAAAAIAIIMGVQAIGATMFPPPPGLDPADPDALSAYMAELPTGTFLLVLASYLLGGLAGGFVAARLAPIRPLLHASLIAVLLTAASVLNLMTLPHPTWFVAANLLLVILVPLLGGRLGERHAVLAQGEV